jgi:ABC-type nitrate/sulfonate/bicarbonate transport system substrate-binding protein
MVGVQSGLFVNEGLHVDLSIENHEMDSVLAVSSGIDLFGVTSATHLLVSRAQGASLVAFATAYIESPVVFYVLRRSGIRSPRDFIGRRVSYPSDSETALSYKALMNKLGIPRSKVQEVPAGSGVDLLVDGTIDVLPGTIGTESYLLKQRGVDYDILSSANYGVHIPGTVYFGTETTVRDQPDTVSRFVRAVIAGWERTYSDQAASAPLISSYDPAVLTPEFVQFKLNQQRIFLRPFGERFCEFEDEHWRFLAKTLLEQRMIKEPTDLSKAMISDFVQDAYRRLDGSRL